MLAGITFHQAVISLLGLLLLATYWYWARLDFARKRKGRGAGVPVGAGRGRGPRIHVVERDLVGLVEIDPRRGIVRLGGIARPVDDAVGVIVGRRRVIAVIRRLVHIARRRLVVAREGLDLAAHGLPDERAVAARGAKGTQPPATLLAHRVAQMPR